jgi:ribosomal protein S8
MNYLLIIDSIVRIKNGYMAKQRSVKIRRSKHVIDMLSILYNYNYILGFHYKDLFNVIVFLKYKAEDPLFNLLDNFKVMSGLRRPFFLRFFNLVSKFNKSLIILNTVKGLNSNFNLIKLTRDSFYNNFNSKLNNLYYLDKININYLNTFSFFKDNFLNFDFYYYFNTNRSFYYNNFNLKYNNLVLLFNHKYIKKNFIYNNYIKYKSKKLIFKKRNYNILLDFFFLFFFSLFNSLRNVDYFFFNFFIKNLLNESNKNPYSFFFKKKIFKINNQKYNFDYLFLFLINFFKLNSKRRFIYSKFSQVSLQNSLLERKDNSIIYRYFFFNKLDYNYNLLGASNFFFFSKFFGYFLNCDIDNLTFLKIREAKIKKNFIEIKKIFKNNKKKLNINPKIIDNIFFKNSKKYYMKFSISFLDYIFAKNIKKIFNIFSKNSFKNISNYLFNLYFFKYVKTKNNNKLSLNSFILKNSSILNNLDNSVTKRKNYYLNLNKYKQWLNLKLIINKKNNNYIFFNDFLLLNFYFNNNKSLKKSFFIKNKYDILKI